LKTPFNKWFAGLSLSRKLYTALFTAGLIGFVLTAVIALATQWFIGRRHLTLEMLTLSKIVAENSRVWVLSGDNKALQATLSTLSATSVMSAWIFDPAGELLVTYQNPQPVSAGQPLQSPAFQGEEQKVYFTGNALNVSQLLEADGKKIGSLTMRISLGGFYADQMIQASVMFGALLLGFMAVMLFAKRLLNMIVEPVFSLLATMKMVSTEKRYQLRSSVESGDELGRLARGYNEILERIEERDALLEKQVRDRTGDLLVAKEKAVGDSLAKSALLAKMSQEMSTPMNTILGMTDLAIDASPNPQQQKFLETIKYSADGLLGILNDFIDFSKIEAGQMQLNQRPFQLGQVIQTVISTMNLLAQEKGLRLECIEADNLHSDFNGDDLRLKQILLNLIGNAIKFTTYGSIIVRFTTREAWCSDGRLQLRVVVQDTGIGIAQDRLDSIFNTIEQGGRDQVRQPGGTGLGLVLSKHLVGMMDGRIWVTSELGVGSTFFVEVCLEPFSGKESFIRKEPQSSQEIVDHLQQQTGISLAQSEKLVKGAVQSFNELLAKSFDFHRQGNWSGLSGSAHALKGVLLQSGLRSLAEKAQRLDMLSRGEEISVEDIDAVLADMQKGLQPFRSSESEIAELTRQHDIEASAKLKKVLVMDDEPLMQYLLPEMLTSLGYTAKAVGDGEAAIQEYRKSVHDGVPYDLVFLDLQVPQKLGGEEAARHILAEFPAAKLLACSGDSEDPVIREYDKYGFCAVFVKPFNLKALEELFQRLSGLGV
jgi:signal transduction histidine kinase/CheY-like chemotaxis protein